MPADPSIDAYIDKAAAFAQPILGAIRARVHAACPAAQETLKWSMPAFTYKGEILCTMAAFKAHAAFGFWRAGQVAEPDARGREGMGQFGRLTRVEELPPEPEFAVLVAKAVALIESGVKAPQMKKPRTEMAIPDDFAAALPRNAAASASFDSFSPSKRRDYLEWISDAKRPDTRAKRIAQSLEWLAEGKPRHWKYEKC